MATEQSRIEYLCEKRGRIRRTEVEAEADGILTPRDTQLTEAADAYPQARDEAGTVVDEARTVTEATYRDLRCDIDRREQKKVRRLWRELREEIEEGSDKPGCNRPPTAPDVPVSDDDTSAELAAREAGMRHEAGELAAYFDSLIAEQAALSGRATTARSDAEALADEVKNAPPDADRIPFLVRCRVLRWRLSDDQMWTGFTTGSFQECLSGTMDLLRDKWAAIVTLAGAVAERECQEESRRTRNGKLRSGAVAELLKRYRDEPAGDAHARAAAAREEQDDEEQDERDEERGAAD